MIQSLLDQNHHHNIQEIKTPKTCHAFRIEYLRITGDLSGVERPLDMLNVQVRRNIPQKALISV
jgi:hypothetical protein